MNSLLDTVPLDLISSPLVTLMAVLPNDMLVLPLGASADRTTSTKELSACCRYTLVPDVRDAIQFVTASDVTVEFTVALMSPMFWLFTVTANPCSPRRAIVRSSCSVNIIADGYPNSTSNVASIAILSLSAMAILVAPANWSVLTCTCLYSSPGLNIAMRSPTFSTGSARASTLIEDTEPAAITAVVLVRALDPSSNRAAPTP